MNIAIILAGGVGNRVGANIPKQFINVLGKPILAYTVEIYQNHSEIDAVEIVCHKDYLTYVNEMVEKYGLTKVKWITVGGADFQHSVINGIYYLKDKSDKDDILVIHFGASPFTSEEIISDAIRVCKAKGNSISTCPFYLLAGNNVNGEMSTEWIDRDKIAVMSTPQCLTQEYALKLYDKAIADNILDKVEPHITSLMQYMGKPIYFSKGSQSNIKITTKEDLEIFEGFILYNEKLH